MGATMMSISGGTEPDRSNVQKSPNPNPFRFKVLNITQGWKYDVISVKYPDCTTYEGLKLLVVRKYSVGQSTEVLDPHFFEGGIVVARCAPTEEGIKLANLIADVD